MIRLSFVSPRLDIKPIMLLESVRMCTGIGCPKKNSNCLRIASESSHRPAKAISLADNAERVTSRDSYSLYEIGIRYAYRQSRELCVQAVMISQYNELIQRHYMQ